MQLKYKRSHLLSNKIEDVGEENDRRESQHRLDEVDGEHHPPEPPLARLHTVWLVLAHLGERFSVKLISRIICLITASFS